MVNIKEIGLTVADKIAEFIGSWTFILVQTVVVVAWIVVNIAHLSGFDPYPFIILNLFFSTEAAYATPLILMAGIRQAQKDNARVDRDLELDNETNIIIKKLSQMVNKISEDLEIDRQALQDHTQLRQDIKEIKQLLKNKKNVTK